jgi:hypothetical protein
MNRSIVAQVSKPAVSPISKLAGRSNAKFSRDLGFMVPMHDLRIMEALHEPSSERGCVEDQPLRVATFVAAAAGAPFAPHTAALRVPIGSWSVSTICES